MLKVLTHVELGRRKPTSSGAGCCDETSTILVADRPAPVAQDARTPRRPAPGVHLARNRRSPARNGCSPSPEQVFSFPESAFRLPGTGVQVGSESAFSLGRCTQDVYTWPEFDPGSRWQFNYIGERV